MSKKSAKKGFPPVIKMNCGNKEGCDMQPYVMPYMGTQEDFRRHAEEKFKPYKKAA